MHTLVTGAAGMRSSAGSTMARGSGFTSSDGSWFRIARFSSCRAGPGSIPSSSTSVSRAFVYASRASACRPDR